MNKAQLAEQIAQKADLSRRDAEQAVDAALETIEEQLARGGEITLTGFGKFHVSDRSARQGRNPQTGEAIRIPARRRLKFVVAKAAKDAALGAH